MPLTFPSHAAAVLPLWRLFPNRLWPAPLVIGSATPDLAYAIGWGGAISHRWETFLLYCVPVGLFVWFWAETLVLPALTRATGEWRGIRFARLWQTRGLPRDRTGWLFGALSIALGATTHVLWDGFTHRDQWPGLALYPDTHWVWLGREWYLANLLQYVSSLFGLVLMAQLAVRAYPDRPHVEAGRWPLLGRLLLATAVVFALFVVVDRHQFAWMNVTSMIWFGFWKLMGVAFLVWTVGSVLILRPFAAPLPE